MKRFCVLMATYNGAQYLDAQLQSIADQTVGHIDILVSDDGSTDATVEKLSNWQSKWSRGTFSIISGPQKGFQENFRCLIQAAPGACDYYAFSDQDDLFDPGKFEVAAKSLAGLPASSPLLYCGRTRLVDESGEPIGYSPLMARPPALANALVQSIAGANTMVMNQVLFEILRQSVGRTGFVSHDWWSYLLATACGGHVVYDENPQIRYRQHGGNLVGSNDSLSARLSRLRMAFAYRFYNWNTANLDGLKACEDLLSSDGRLHVERFRQARQAGPFALLRLIRDQAIYRQSHAGTTSLILAAMIGRF